MYPQSTIDRFWPKVNRDGPTPAHCPELGPCWLWTGGHLTAGYGSFKVESYKIVLAHRFAWELANGPVPPGMFILHRCDNPSCVRYDGHLCVGTPADNTHDMWRKGRQGFCPPQPRLMCRRGLHPMVPGNLRYSQGKRRCHACDLDGKRQYRAQRTVHAS